MRSAVAVPVWCLVGCLIVTPLGGCTGEPRPASSPTPTVATSSTSPSPTPTPPATPSSPAEHSACVPGGDPPSRAGPGGSAGRPASAPGSAGQVIVARYAGLEPPIRLVRRLHLEGVVLFDDNVASTRQVRRSTARLRTGVGRAWPLFVGVDQEGGLVTRVRADATRFPAFMSAGAAGRPALTRRAAQASADQLRRLGFTVDFAPVADVTSGPGDPTIGSRSVGSAPEVVATHAVAAARGYLAAG
ncbi:MAG: glycoside hydrolase family 3 N-terminal domain-containing protein [Nocardioides sp.]